MKFLFILSFLFSSAAFSADFPTGAFSCNLTFYKSIYIVAVKVSEANVGGITLPLVELSGFGHYRGIPAMVVESTGVTMILPGGIADQVLKFSTDSLLSINGNNCEKE